MIRLTNIERQKAGLTALLSNSLLEQAAQSHVSDMDASNKYLGHIGSNGSTPTSRISATGYKSAWFNEGNGRLRTVANENVAAFSGAFSATQSATKLAEQVVQAWMNSEGHRAAILDPATKEIGVGFDYDTETDQWYWAQTFGYPWAPGLLPVEAEKNSTLALAIAPASVTEAGAATLGTDHIGISTTPATKSITFAADSAIATLTGTAAPDSFNDWQEPISSMVVRRTTF